MPAENAPPSDGLSSAPEVQESGGQFADANGKQRLSLRERVKVITAALASLLLLGLLVWCVPNIWPLVRDGLGELIFDPRRGRLGVMIILVSVFAIIGVVVGVPAAIVLSLLTLVQGIAGQSTRFTGWVLARLQRADRRLHSEEPGEKPARLPQEHLPPVVSWGILLGFLALMMLLLAFAAR